MAVLRPFRAVRYTGNGSSEFTPGEDPAPRFDDAFLLEDPKPALYLYRQRFIFPGDTHRSIRDSVIGLLDRTESVVYPHEEIFPERADACRRTLDESGLESSPIFLWVDSEWPAHLNDTGDEQQILPITAPAAIARVQGALHGKALFLADGHHRFAAGWQMAAIHFRDKSLKTLASHRLILDSTRVCLPALTPIQNVQAFFSSASPDVFKFAVILPGAELFGFEIPFSAGARNLTVLHRDILRDAPVRPVRGIESAFEAVRDGSAQMAVLVEPLTLNEIEQDARRAILLPPKSTDFFPKAAGGLIMHRHQNESLTPPVAQIPGVRYPSS